MPESATHGVRIPVRIFAVTLCACIWAAFEIGRYIGPSETGRIVINKKTWQRLHDSNAIDVYLQHKMDSSRKKAALLARRGAHLQAAQLYLDLAAAGSLFHVTHISQKITRRGTTVRGLLVTERGSDALRAEIQFDDVSVKLGQAMQLIFKSGRFGPASAPLRPKMSAARP